MSGRDWNIEGLKGTGIKIWHSQLEVPIQADRYDDFNHTKMILTGCGLLPIRKFPVELMQCTWTGSRSWKG